MIRKRPENAAPSSGARKSSKAGRLPQGASAKRTTASERDDAEALTGAALELEPVPVDSDADAAAVADGIAGPDAELTEAGEAGEQPSDTGAEPADAEPEPVDIDALALRIEALLFASGQALGTRRLSKALEVSAEDVHQGLEVLARNWSDRASALELVEVSGGWRLMTRAVFHDDVAQLTAKIRLEKLSPAALETLAVVAYRQPIGRADIEAIRGVQCGPLLRVLLDRDLIRISGRSSEPGHPLLYGTSKRFLDHFGLASLKNLPDVKDLLNVS